MAIFYTIKASILRTIFCRCMSCTPVKVKVIVAIVTSNLISHIMILLAFIITTWLVDNFFVFWIGANCNVREVAVRTGDRKVIQCSFLSLGLLRNYNLQIPSNHCNQDTSILHTETVFSYLLFHCGNPLPSWKILS